MRLWDTNVALSLGMIRNKETKKKRNGANLKKKKIHTNFIKP